MKIRTRQLFVVIFFFLLNISEKTQFQTSEIRHEEFEDAVQSFGQYIYDVSAKLTHLEEIKKNFSTLKLKKIDALEMVKEMVSDIELMLKWKIQSVERIKDAIQQSMHEKDFEEDLTLEKFQYYNAKTINENETYFPTALPLVLSENFRFKKEVNTTFSSIHVATNVYNQDVGVLNAIKGSESANRFFIDNYKSDPTILWQYFGSVTGFLRNYPGIRWCVDQEKIDTFDCRMRPWYVEAAASPKDIVILLDSSGSLYGFKQEIARHVVSAILDTLNSNDFVAVYEFSDEVKSVHDCFEGYMVMANRENTAVLKEHLQSVKYNNVANFSKALTAAFELLGRYNESGLGSQCNQAIMLVTDGAPETFESIFEKYNYPEKRVRIFTYLIGREVTQVDEVLTMACEYRGYYTQVKTLAEIREQVQKYIPVMARPMIMQNIHSFVWTPVYADINDVRYCYKFPDYQFCDENSKYYQFMTTVATPVFDLKNVSRDPKLLGVAGTDIPTREILKLAPPYQVGVNGYPFIITNNGHILSHPDLRPLFKDKMKLDYNTIDLSETELSDTDIEPSEKDPEIMLLRERMVERETGSANITVRVHYDKMKRVMSRTNVYYFTPINRTPFSFAVALPDGYSEYRAGVKEELNESEALEVLKKDNKWKVHPDWIYCIELFLERRNCKTSKEQMLDLLDIFINKKKRKNVKFEELRNHTQKSENHSHIYCDGDLIRMLLTDITLTDVYKEQPTERNGAVLTFVSTRSGLTRWQDFLDDKVLPNLTQPDFSEIYTRSIDETWYKRAVDQYLTDDQSFIFSVPFDAGEGTNDTYVTGSHAIFVEDPKQNVKVPVAVVGLQFEYSYFAELFMDFSFDCEEQDKCTKNCRSDDVNCYLLDDSGFVVFSEKFEDTGKFFGEVDGITMKSLIIEGIYHGYVIYDFQGMCEEIDLSSTASYITKPFELMLSIFSWFWRKLILFYIEYNLYTLWSNDWIVLAHPIKDAEFDEGNPGIQVIDEKEDKLVSCKENPGIQVIDEKEDKLVSCNKNSTLYRLIPEQVGIRSDRNYSVVCNPYGCEDDWAEQFEAWLWDANETDFQHPKPYNVHLVPHTNLLLVAVDTNCTCHNLQTVSIAATQMKFGNNTRCEMMRTIFHRRPPAECYNYHPDELEIRECGGSTVIQQSVLLFLISLFTSAASLQWS